MSLAKGRISRAGAPIPMGMFLRPRLNQGQKLFLVATLPLILTAAAVAVVVTLQSRQQVEARVQRTFLFIGAAMLVALLLVFVTGLFITIRERRLADAKLKRLTQRVFDAQEALTNIERHSGATRVDIDLRGHARGGTLRITDNGRGIDPAQSRAGGGLGLRNMQERIDQLDGRLVIGHLLHRRAHALRDGAWRAAGHRRAAPAGRHET
tara:strand:+ start:1051 stop:1677 length:627 start_codon:yes stop_codon:yes gene_type:complete